MKFRAIKDSDYERARDALISKCEKAVNRTVYEMPETFVKRSAFSRLFCDMMQAEAERAHLTDGMTPNETVTLARQLKIQVTASRALGPDQTYDYLGGDSDALG